MSPCKVVAYHTWENMVEERIAVSGEAIDETISYSQATVTLKCQGWSHAWVSLGRHVVIKRPISPAEIGTYINFHVGIQD